MRPLHLAGLVLPAALVLLADGDRLAHALSAVAAGAVAWRVWRTPHPWVATLFVAVAPVAPDAYVLAAALAAWAVAPPLGVVLAFPFAFHAWGHAWPWLAVGALAAVLLAGPSIARHAPVPDARGVGRLQPAVLVGAAIVVPWTAPGLHAAYALVALVLLVVVQAWAALLALRAQAHTALAGPLAVAAAVVAGLGVRLAGLGDATPFVLLAVVLAAPALAPVLALATRRLSTWARGPIQGGIAALMGLATQGLPA